MKQSNEDKSLEREVERKGSTILSKIEDIADENELMSPKIVELKQQVKQAEKNKSEFGYGAMGMTMEELNSKKAYIENFIDNVSIAAEGLKIILKSDKINDMSKYSTLIGIEETLQNKKGFITENKLRNVVGDVNHKLSTMKKEYTSMIPEENEVIKAIESNISKSQINQEKKQTIKLK